MFIESLIENLVGKSFEIECSDIEVHGSQDHCPPLFKGPGTISGEKRGSIFFRLHNQIELTKDALKSLGFTETNRDTKTINPVRIFAEDYNGCSWTGGWSIPSNKYIANPQAIIHGEFEQLATRIDRQEENSIANTTEIVFGEQLKLPYTQLAEEKRYSAGKQIYRKTWHDRHELCLDGSKICLYQSANSERTHITAEHTEGFSPPYIENWLPEALQFICARLTYPRLVIRHFEKDALVFLRSTPLDSKTGMPAPLINTPQLAGLWKMYIAYLSKCKTQHQFKPLELTRILSEIIISSTGTIHSFVLSLVVGVENLAKQLFDEVGVIPVDQDVCDSLEKHLNEWHGDDLVRKRVISMLSMLKQQSVVECLKKLKADGVIEKKQLSTWRKFRPYLTHGGIGGYKSDQSLWIARNILISMLYRLAYRIIGFKGKIVDIGDDPIVLKEFNWRC